MRFCPLLVARVAVGPCLVGLALAGAGCSDKQKDEAPPPIGAPPPATVTAVPPGAVTAVPVQPGQPVPVVPPGATTTVPPPVATAPPTATTTATAKPPTGTAKPPANQPPAFPPIVIPSGFPTNLPIPPIPGFPPPQGAGGGR